jgi:nitrate reductase gamma subunit
MIESIDYPKPWLLFWPAGALALTALAVGLAQRWRGWSRGLAVPSPARARRGRVAGLWVVEVFGQRQLRRLSPLRWAAHGGIFWGFLSLVLLSTFHVGLSLFSFLGSDGAAWFLRGAGRALLKGWGDTFGLVLLAGLLLALARRAARRPAAADSPESDLPLLLFLLGMTLSGFLLEWLRSGASGVPAAALRPWLTALWTVHGLAGVALVAWVPRGRLLHGLLAPLVIALNARAEHARKDLSWPSPTRHAAPGSPKA